MKHSRNSKARFMGFSLILLVALGLMVNMATANTPRTGQETTPEPTPLEEQSAPNLPDKPQFTQTSCAMSIDDLGDNNPFTYSFSAINTNNIASYLWDFGDMTSGTGTPINHTYTTTGTFNVVLICTPTPGFGAPIVLNGSISVSQPPNPGFYLTPGQVVTSGTGVTFNAINTSTPAGLISAWCVSITPPPAPPIVAGFFDALTCLGTSDSYLLNSFAPLHYYYLKVTNAGGQAGVAVLSFVLNAPQPSATFSMNPQTGPAPLNVFIDGQDLMTGPITSWQYTITGPGCTPCTYLTEDVNLTALVAGTYTVQLDYAGPGGTGFIQRTLFVYAAESTVNANFVWTFGENISGGRRVCFENTSTGTYANSYWDFDNSTAPTGISPTGPSEVPTVGDPNDTIVCFDYPPGAIGTTITARLRVTGTNIGVTSEAVRSFTLLAAPEANFTWSPGTPIWGQYVTFDPDTSSTGTITNPNGYDWQFDFGGDGSIDATRDNIRYPNDVQLPVGVTRVILTVSGPGGSDTQEYFITVARRDITCAITGDFSILPSQGAQNYTSVVTGTNGPNYGTRTLTYAWTIDPNTPMLPMPVTTANLNGVDWSTFGNGSFNVSLVVTTSDGAVCTTNETVVRNWSPVECTSIGISGAGIPGGTILPANIFASASPVTYTANINAASLNGRTITGYVWTINGVPQAETGATMVRPYTNPVANDVYDVGYTVTVDNADTTFSDCFEQDAVTVQPYPTPTCSLSNPWGVPQYADGLVDTFNASTGSVFGRPITRYRVYLTNPDPGTENLVYDNVASPFPFSHTMTNDHIGHPDFSYRVEIDFDNGNATTSTALCNSGIVGVQPYPTPTCSVNTGVGSGTPLPQMGNITASPTGDTTPAQHNHTYQAQFSLFGTPGTLLPGINTVTYNWLYPVNAPTVVSMGGTGDYQTQVRWSGNQPTPQGSLPPGTPATLDLSINWLYPNGTPAFLDCSQRDVAVRVNNLTCANPTGDITPLPGDSNIYTRVTGGSSIFGRANFTTWFLEQETAPLSNVWVPVLLADASGADTDGTTGSPYVLANQTSGAIQTLNFSAFAPDTRYRVSYRVDVTNDVIDTCTSGWVILTAEATGVGFTCDTFYNGAPNNFTVANATGNQTVTVNVDNGNVLPLVYAYFMVGANGAETLIFTSAPNIADGDVAQALASTLFAPPASPVNGNVGNYNMRIRVTDSSGASMPAFCDMQSPQRYIVGAVDATFNIEAYGGGRSGFAVGECFNSANASVTNVGATLGDPATNLLYTWTIGGGPNVGARSDNTLGSATFTTYTPFAPDPACIGFNQAGSYTMSLTATNDFQGDTAFRQTNSQNNTAFRICALQGLSVGRVGGNFEFNNQAFTVIPTGELTGNYTFQIRDVDSGTIVVGPTNQAGVVFNNGSLGAGNYRLEVSRAGCLGVASAQLNYTLLGANDIIARYNFRNNINAGLAPLEICFNDTSVSGTPITLWEWDWEGDGTYDYTYNTYQDENQVCYTYPTAGVYYPVLRVNNGTLTATAQNPVRVYTVLESQLGFSASPAGGGQWCYTPDMTSAPGGTTITGWSFGDTNTAPAVTPPANGSGVICHTYGAAGTYYVEMCFTGSSLETGCVVRPIIVELPGNPVATMSGSGVCALNRNATFTLTNTSMNNMTSPAQVIFYNASGSPISYQTTQLLAGASQNIILTNMQGVVRMRIPDYGVDTGSTVVCNYTPILSITSVCSGVPGYPEFTLTNAAAAGPNPMFGTQTYEVRNSANAVVASGTLTPLGSGVSSIVIVTLTSAAGDPYDTYSITSPSNGFNGGALTLAPSACNAPRPTLSVNTVCAATLQLIISNDNAVVTPQSYEVVDTVTMGVVASGNYPISAAGGSINVALTGQDPYRAYLVRTVATPNNGYVTPLSFTTTPCVRPNLVITHDCASPVTFTVTNNGGDMIQPSTLTYVGSGTIAPTSVQLVGGGSTVITASGMNPYDVFTLSINDFNTNGVLVTATRNCVDPVLTVSNNTCATYPLTFTVNNTGGAMIIGQAYQITNSASAVVLSGTLNIGSGGNQVITMTGINPYATYTITTTGFAGTFTAGSAVNACVAPVLSAVSTCDYPATFTISNTGGGDMITSQTFTITHKDGTVLAVVPNTFDLNVGEDLVITLPATSDPYGLYTLTSTGFAGSVTNTQNCNLPVLTVTSSCLFPVQFLVRNVGGDMLVDHTYTITNALGFDLTPALGTFRLATNDVFLANVPVTDLSVTITFATNTYGIFNTTQVTCVSGGGVTSNPVIDLGDEPLAPTITPITLETVLLNRLSPDVLGLPAWSGVPTCGHGCPIFRLYHTNQSGDWDIWRLDGADMDTETSFHTNLTERDSADVNEINAPDVTDLAPSLSPNNEWFVFSSNRDGNWEIYVAPTDGNLNYAQRVTYNDIAVDVHPVWGPSNYIVYESTRTGNWDLFMVDVVSGVEYQLTDSPSDEQNAAWSADGSKVSYQSDVDGSWQVYELDLETMTVRRLTNEANGAMDGVYSPDDARMVYRTVADNGNSVIKVMTLATTRAVDVTVADENATVPVFSPSGRYLAYQSNADGDLDIYVHEFGTGLTRKLTDNTIDDYAPTWLCGDDRLVFTSEIYGDPNIFEVDVLPITASPILVEEDAMQLTFEDYLDVYPVMNTPFERASREESIVMRDTQYPDGLIHKGFTLTVEDTSTDSVSRDDWAELNVCPAGNFAIGGGG